MYTGYGDDGFPLYTVFYGPGETTDFRCASRWHIMPYASATMEPVTLKRDITTVVFETPKTGSFDNSRVGPCNVTVTRL